MTEVLQPPGHNNDRPFYSSPDGYALKRSSISYSSFLSRDSPSYNRTRASPPSPPHTQPTFSSYSTPSSTSTTTYHSFTDLTNTNTLPPTPASSVSLDDDDDRHLDNIAFPSYDDAVLSSPPLVQQEIDPICSLVCETATVRAAKSTDLDDSITFSSSSTPLQSPPVSDDSAARPDPAHHVDYLSHRWREEDIWASWRHIVSKRNVLPSSSRLENASWRTWAKSKYRLSTVSPERLNWLKESDVTWLYGPLQPAISRPITHDAPDPTPEFGTDTKSSNTKKPILKKRTMSEVMLRRSLSANSLVKQAAASVQAQQYNSSLRPSNFGSRGFVDPVARFNQARIPTHKASETSSSTASSSVASSSGDQTPVDEYRRHIRFDDKVGQCIAIDCKGPDMYDDTDIGIHGDGSDSDDGVLTMQRTRRRRATTVRKPASQSNKAPARIIEKLPDTTLKYKSDSPGSRKNSTSSFTTSFWSSNKITPSASQETLRPLNASRNFLISSDDEDDVGPDTAWHPPVLYGGAQAVNEKSMAGDETLPSLRQTPSGMLMPYDDDDEEIATEGGLFTRVSDTFNTARDIAHVIWNVGWRK